LTLIIFLPIVGFSYVSPYSRIKGQHKMDGRMWYSTFCGLKEAGPHWLIFTILSPDRKEQKPREGGMWRRRVLLPIGVGVNFQVNNRTVLCIFIAKYYLSPETGTEREANRPPGGWRCKMQGGWKIQLAPWLSLHGTV